MIGIHKAWFAQLLLGSALTVACGSSVDDDVLRLQQGVVYGTDDRQELYLGPTDELRRFGERSVVALVGGLAPDGSGSAIEPDAVFSAPTWSERRHLCPGVRFAEQPSAAVCSGVLIDSDLVLTAGHCARNLACDSLNLVFGYHYREGGAVPAIGADDIYHCAEISSFEIPSAAGELDYGWIRLDRPVSPDKKPAAIDTAKTPIDPNSALRAFTFGGGVPLKLQTDVPIADARANTLDYFVTALDAFEGASGAPLVRDDGTVAGILVHGNADYQQSNAGCTEVSVLSQADAAERATYTFRALEGLCRDSPESTRLCEQPRTDAPRPGCSFGAPPSRTSFIAWLPAGAVLVLVLLGRVKRDARVQDRSGGAPCAPRRW